MPGAARGAGRSSPAARRSRLPRKPHEPDAPCADGAADLRRQARRAGHCDQFHASSAGVRL